MYFGGGALAGSSGVSEPAVGNGAKDEDEDVDVDEDDTMLSMHALTWGILPNIKYPCRLTM
jgi:hypothetical protein